MQIIRYVNHNNEEYILHGAGHTFVENQAAVLREYRWSFSVANRPSGYGGSASGFARYPIERPLLVAIKGFTATEFNARANALLAIKDADIMANEPGRLYIGNQYIVCYLGVNSSIDAHSPRAHFVRKSLGVLVVEPYWCTDVSTIFNILEDDPDTTGKKYNLKYAYRYGSGYSVSTLYNNHYAEAPAIITIYGAIENPSIQIADNVFNVDVALTATARLIIDQVKHKIYTVTESGVRTNVFNARNKAYDIFTPIAAGANQVLYSGEFKFEVTLVMQRSEPQWV